VFVALAGLQAREAMTKRNTVVGNKKHRHRPSSARSTEIHAKNIGFPYVNFYDELVLQDSSQCLPVFHFKKNRRMTSTIIRDDDLEIDFSVLAHELVRIANNCINRPVGLTTFGAAHKQPGRSIRDIKYNTEEMDHLCKWMKESKRQAPL
jgi:hypothetical protein